MNVNKPNVKAGEPEG